MWNLPNSLTLARILMAPLLVVVLLTEIPDKAFWGLGIFLVAASTDLMDGIIARRTNRITVTGALLDPIADKLLMSAAFISLVELGLAPAWMVFCIVGREFAVTALRMVAIQRQLSIAANIWGKVKTGTQVAAVSLLIFGHGDPLQWRVVASVHHWRVLGAIALWLALAFTLASMVVYFWQNWSVVRGDQE
jgi:CDP-diacylglycerol--glycerol-3-phosphate 3-phosphatidyltransferase